MYNVTAIVAADMHGGIGINNKLPWNIPEDLEWFKANTLDNICVASKSLYLRDLKNLKGRHWVAVSSNPGELSIPEYNYNFHTPDTIAEDLKSNIMIVGGPKVYAWANEYINTVILTRINSVYDCDAHINYLNLLKDKTLMTKLERSTHTYELWS